MARVSPPSSVPSRGTPAGRLRLPDRDWGIFGQRQLLGYFLRRLAFLPFAILILVTASFALVDLVPTNPARQILGELATPEQLRTVNHALGFDLPVPDRYLVYMRNLLHGDLGRSYYSGEPVLTDIGRHLPNTIELVVPSLILAVILGVALGYLTAHVPLRREGRIGKAVFTILQATPDFVMAVLLIFVLFSQLRLAAAPVGRLGIGDAPPDRITGFLYVDTLLTGRFDLVGSEISHSLLPILALALGLTPAFARISRSNLASVLTAGHIEFARACGLSRWTTATYVLRSARTSLVTYFGLLAANLVGGAAIIETIFSWNGIGQWAIVAIEKMDIVQVQGFVLVVAAGALLIFLAVDVIVAALDPRITYASG